MKIYQRRFLSYKRLSWYSGRRLIDSMKSSLKSNQKRAMILRWGGMGDVVMATVLFPKLKDDGDHATASSHRGRQKG